MAKVKAKNVILKKGFTQVCVWPGCGFKEGKKGICEFEKLMKKQFGAKVQYLEQVKTKPDRNVNGYKISGTGGRNDLLFAVRDKDVGVFAIARLMHGIRWIEDVLSVINNDAYIYPKRLSRYISWDANGKDEPGAACVSGSCNGCSNECGNEECESCGGPLDVKDSHLCASCMQDQAEATADSLADR